MDKNKIEEFVLELIEEIDDLGQSCIWEYSGNISEDLNKLKQQIEDYKEKLRELLK